MPKTDLHHKLIYTTLTLNSTTLYTYENHSLVHQVNNLNCSEILSQELGLINASKTLVGSLNVSTSSKTTNSKLVLYFMKKSSSNSDGSSDLVTVVVIAHCNVNRTLVLTVLKKVTDKYIEFRRDVGKAADEPRARLGEFKLYMNQIIKYEEMNYDSNPHDYSRSTTPSESDLLLSTDPSSLVPANEEVEEVRNIMLSNINKLLSRDKVSTPVNHDRSSTLFLKHAPRIGFSWGRFGMGVVLACVVGYVWGGVFCGWGFERCR